MNVTVYVERSRVNRPIPPEAAEKVATAFMVDQNGCWISTRTPNKVNGYTYVSWRENGQGYSTTGHRAAWTHHNGPIPDAMTIDHLCKVRRCINPAHLRLLSNSENARRQYGRDWPLGECRNGHPDSMREPAMRGGKPHSICRPCQDANNARLSARLKAERAARKAAS